MQGKAEIKMLKAEEIRLALEKTGPDCSIDAACNLPETFPEVSTDTRTLEQGELFVALVGENFDGHDFVETALKKQAGAIVISKDLPHIMKASQVASQVATLEDAFDGNSAAGTAKTADVAEAAKDVTVGISASGVPFIKVPDTLQFYQYIGRERRLAVDGLQVVAVTGSNGKTSTKDMIASVLEASYRVIKTQGNFNNEIGLPHTLLRIQNDTEIAVTEMGMRAQGQIREMCKIACPDVAVISNVGSTHIGELGSLENIAAAKSEILENLPENGLAVLNGDLPLVRAMEEKSAAPVIFFGLGENNDVRAVDLNLNAEGSSFTCILKSGEKQDFHISQIGEHNVMNALSAIAIGLHFGLKLPRIAEALGKGSVSGSRQEVLKIGEYTIINDAYNASPASMDAALKTLAMLKDAAIAENKKARSVAVLADMLELGETSKEAHASVGRMAVENGTDLLIAYGKEALYIAEAAEECGKGADANVAAKGAIETYYAENRQLAEDILRDKLQPGDIVLLKGSHSMEVAGIIDTVFSK